MSTTAPRLTPIALPEYADWSGSDEWKTHLFEHDSRWDEDQQRFVPAAVEGCPGCAVGPMLKTIHEAWQSGNADLAATLWSLQDGYGEPGHIPGQGYDWSGIRDSSPAAVARMFAAVKAAA